MVAVRNHEEVVVDRWRPAAQVEVVAPEPIVYGGPDLRAERRKPLGL
jgi:hypothetical protein